MSVGDHADQNGKEISDACVVREMAGDDGHFHAATFPLKRQMTEETIP